MKLFRAIATVFFTLFIINNECNAQGLDPQATYCSVVDIKHDLATADELNTRSKSDSAEIRLRKALVCAKSLDRKDFQADILFELARVEFRKIGPRDIPTKLFLESLELYTELENTEGILKCNLQLGVLNFDISNFEAALEYLNNVLTSKTASKATMALAYYLSALSYSEMDIFDESELMFNKAQKHIAPTDAFFILQVQTFKGKLYINKGEPQKAIGLFDSLSHDYQNTIDQENYAPIYAFKARAYLKVGEYQKAIKNAKHAYKLSAGKGSNAIYLREAQSVLHQSFYATGQLDSAYFFLQSLNTIEDSLSSQQIQQRITQMSGQFDFQQKLKAQQAEQALKDQLAEQEIQREKLFRNLILIGFVVVAIFAFTFFKQRSKIAREKDRSDSLLLNILPEEIAHELKEKGSAEARNFENVSILFTDFEKFTQTSEKLTASQLVDEINTCFRAFDHIVDKYDLEKIKTIGDAYMAAGGLLIPKTDSVRNTVLAALEMQRFILSRSAEQKSKNLPSFSMRVGIHTGPVVAGIVGVKKFQYDIWGDTVNTASRMESHGEVGKVNISEDTYQLIKSDPDFSFESRGKMEVKGKGETEMWFVNFKNQ